MHDAPPPTLRAALAEGGAGMAVPPAALQLRLLGDAPATGAGAGAGAEEECADTLREGVREGVVDEAPLPPPVVWRLGVAGPAAPLLEGGWDAGEGAASTPPSLRTTPPRTCTTARHSNTHSPGVGPSGA